MVFTNDIVENLLLSMVGNSMVLRPRAVGRVGETGKSDPYLRFANSKFSFHDLKSGLILETYPSYPHLGNRVALGFLGRKRANMA